MDQADIQKYCHLMEEVKLRVWTIDDLLISQPPFKYQTAKIESIGLQFRKVLELIAFGSLVSNKEVYMQTYDNFSKAWNAELILKDLERVNPDFYPVPILEHRQAQGEVAAHIEPVKENFLTRKQFVMVYKKCHAVVHASNPNGSKFDPALFESRFPKWRELIVNLLRSHTIRLVGSEAFYLIHMQERSDARVHHYTCEPKTP